MNPWTTGSYPLMSEDGDWYAFPKTLTKRDVVSEMIHNYADWWLDDAVWYDDDDRPHGWIEAIKSMFGVIREARLRPAFEGEVGFSDDWWYEDPDGSVECWVVAL